MLACCHCGRRTLFHKQKQHISAEENIEDAEGKAQTPHHFQPGAETLLDPAELPGTQVLGRKVGNPVANGGKGCNNQVI